MSLYQKIVDRGLNASVFLFFALSLSAPSGYSYGAVAIALSALAGIALVRPQVKSHKETLSLVSVLLLMGLLWTVALDSWLSKSGIAYGAKYALAAISLWYLAKQGVAPKYIVWGIAAGDVGALGVAAYQYLVLHWIKVSGFTNAIQYGGIAMYMGIAAWCMALLGRGHWLRMVALGICGACGVLAALLSESRGSWVVVPLLLAAICLMAWLNGYKRAAITAVLVVVVGSAVLALPAYKKFEQRANIAVQEAHNYWAEPQKYAATSVGQRLEQWRLAIHLIEKNPLTGAGLEGYPKAKQAMVDAGQAHPSVMAYGHAHNEVLDMWVKRGLLGLLVLLLFYAVPLYVFWPTPKRLGRVNEAGKPELLALRAAAALLPIAYFGFGWTQVFFAHNSGNMFYIFSIAAFWGGICRLEGAGKATPSQV